MVQTLKRGCPLGPTFFGLNSEYKIELHKTLFSIAYHSNGAFTVEQLYNMPIYLRIFYSKQLHELKNMEAESYKKSTQKGRKPSKR